MEGSIKEQKIRAMKSYRRAKFLYNFVLYSLTSVITCFFFSFPFWSPSVARLFASLQTNVIPCFLSAKCLFFVGNLIVVILIGESRLGRSSSSELDVYDEYLARSRRANANVDVDGSKVEERGVVPHDQEKRKGYLRSCRSEVWGGSERKREKSRGKKEDETRIGMRSCKSEVWGEKKEESYKVQKKEEKGAKNVMMSCKSEVWGEKKEESYKVQKKEENGAKNGMMRSCKSEIWGENEAAKKEESYKVQRKEEKGAKNVMSSCKSEVCGENEAAKKKEESYKVQKEEENGTKNGMRSCRSEIWDENTTTKTEETKEKADQDNKAQDDQQKKLVMRSCRSAIWGENDQNQKGMRSCKSAVWGESETVRRTEEERGSVTPEDLNKRVEAFIARVNKQRLLEANLGSDTTIN